MDSLSAVSSLEAVMNISVNISSLCQYSLVVKNPITEIHFFSNALDDIYMSLWEVKQFLNGQKKSQLSTTHKLSDSLEECYQKLQELKVQLESGKTPKAMQGFSIQALKWPFTSKQMEKIVDELKKYEQAFRLALQIEQT
jgi:DNA-binding transcriptional MerR regulator